MLLLVTRLWIDEAVLSYVAMYISSQSSNRWVMVIYAFPSIENGCKKRRVRELTHRKRRSDIYACLSKHRKMQTRLLVVVDIKDPGRKELQCDY